MKKYPKKCPVCGEDMEPVFEEEIGTAHMGVPLPTSPLIEPKKWHCVYCNKE